MIKCSPRDLCQHDIRLPFLISLELRIYPCQEHSIDNWAKYRLVPQSLPCIYNANVSPTLLQPCNLAIRLEEISSKRYGYYILDVTFIASFLYTRRNHARPACRRLHSPRDDSQSQSPITLHAPLPRGFAISNSERSLSSGLSACAHRFVVKPENINARRRRCQPSCIAAQRACIQLQTK